MDANNDIVTILTIDIAALNRAVKNTEVSEDTLLGDLASMFQTYGDECHNIGNKRNSLNAAGQAARFIPYLNESQFLDEIKGLMQTVIILDGIDPQSRLFHEIRMKAWHRYEKVITEESFRVMAESMTQQFIDIFKASNPRNPTLPSVQDRITTEPEERYRKFVELVNEQLSMKEIAIAFGLSIPATYLIRSQYKDRLVSDSNVDKNAPAMRFNKR